jgi:hypothetical protein
MNRHFRSQIGFDWRRGDFFFVFFYGGVPFVLFRFVFAANGFSLLFVPFLYYL